MPEQRKILAQLEMANASLETLYTVPQGASVEAALTICNPTAGALTYRVALSPEAAAIADKHYVYYDQPIAAKATAITSVTLGPLDIVRVYGSGADLVANLAGKLITD